MNADGLGIHHEGHQGHQGKSGSIAAWWPGPAGFASACPTPPGSKIAATGQSAVLALRARPPALPDGGVGVPSQRTPPLSSCLLSIVRLYSG